MPETTTPTRACVSRAQGNTKDQTATTLRMTSNMRVITRISESNQSIIILTSKLTSTIKNLEVILVTSIELTLNLIRLAYTWIRTRVAHGALSAYQL